MKGRKLYFLSFITFIILASIVLLNACENPIMKPYLDRLLANREGKGTYTITIETEGNGTASANMASATPGTQIMINATAEDGNRLNSWQIVSGSISLFPNTMAPLAQFLMPGNNVIIRAVFEELPPGVPSLNLQPWTIELQSVVGYETAPTQTVTIHNNGTGAAQVSGITLGGANPDSFTLENAGSKIINPGADSTFTVQPNASLSIGTYNAVIIVNYNDDAIATAIVSFSVTYTVIFDSNGGSYVAPIAVISGATISAPTDPTTSVGGATLNRFRGWYTDNGTFNNLYDFNTPITANRTIYADWGYRIGDIGPGTGRIFHRSEEGFTVQGYEGSTDSFDSYIAHYLEAAPVNISGTPIWANVNGIYHLIPGLSQSRGDQSDWAIGRGRTNTAIIIAHGISFSYTTPAANACRVLTTGGTNDWFLPSRNELSTLFAASRSWISNTGQYWSSSQSQNNLAWTQQFYGGTQVDSVKYVTTHLVRAIRAF